MQPRLFTYIVVAGLALAYTWGYGPHSFSLATAAPVTNGTAGIVVREGPRAAMAVAPVSSLSASLDALPAGHDMIFTLHVTNRAGRKVEVDFPSGRTHDLIVLNAAGHEVWRWSTGQMFTQSVRNTPLDARQTLSYTVRWHRPVGHGPLTAVGTLSSNNYPVQSRTTFTLP